MADRIFEVCLLHWIDYKHKGYDAVAAVSCLKVLSVRTRFKFVESVFSVFLTRAYCCSKICLLDRVDSEVECDNAVTALDGLEILSVCAICRFVESVLCISIALADSVINHGVVNRIDCEEECYNTVAALACLEILYVCVNRWYGIFGSDCKSEADIDISVAYVVVNGLSLVRINREDEFDNTVAAC